MENSPSFVRRISGSTAVLRPASDLLLTARERERAGCIQEAIDQYQMAISQTEREGDNRVLAEALRRLAGVMHQRGETQNARELAHRSYDVARKSGNDLQAGEALNTIGVMLMLEGMLPDARVMFNRAVKLGGNARELRVRIERNLGVVANIQGELDDALQHYSRSLEESISLGNDLDNGLTYNNLGLISAQKQLYTDADRYWTLGREAALRTGDVALEGQCILNHADAMAANGRHDEALKNAEAALAIFDRLGNRQHKANAYRVIGIVYRDMGKRELAEARLRAAIELSSSAGSILYEAQSTREMALLYQAMGRNQDALTSLTQAHRLFGKLDARRDLINVGGLMADLEGTYFAVVKEWGQSIESSDSYTFGHCERVADNAVAVARSMGFTEEELTTIRLGAYLHDVGKVKVPHEILNKPGKLTDDEFEVIKMHPVWGIELLAKVEFPWDIKPIIRWHHEKYDGTGYPDQLKGDDIPLSAQIVGIVDVWDALTTTRSYRTAMGEEKALEIMTKMQSSWSTPVFDAFMRVREDAAGNNITSIASAPSAERAA